MYFFLLVAIPTTIIGIAAAAGEVASALKLAAVGILVGLVGILILPVIDLILPVTHRPFRYYLVLMTRYHFVPHTIVLGGWVLFRGYRNLENEAGRRRWLDFASFAAGFYTTLAVALVVASSGEPDLHGMIVLPLSWLGSFLLTAVLLVIFFEGYGIYRFLYAAAVIGLPLATGSVSYLQQTYRTGFAVGLAVVIAGSGFLVWSSRDRY